MRAASSPHFKRVMGKIGFPRLTRHTVQDLSEIAKELEKVRIDGYAVDIEEMRESVGWVPAPVYNAAKEIVACAAIVCPSSTLGQKKRYEYGQIVREFVEQMSQDYSK